MLNYFSTEQPYNKQSRDDTMERTKLLLEHELIQLLIKWAWVHTAGSPYENSNFENIRWGTRLVLSMGRTDGYLYARLLNLFAATDQWLLVEVLPTVDTSPGSQHSAGPAPLLYEEGTSPLPILSPWFLRHGSIDIMAGVAYYARSYCSLLTFDPKPRGLCSRRKWL